MSDVREFIRQHEAQLDRLWRGLEGRLASLERYYGHFGLDADGCFACAICGARVSSAGRFMRHGFDDPQLKPGVRDSDNIRPICRQCETHYARGVGKPGGGNRLDRRRATQIAALAGAIEHEARRRQWPPAWR